MKKAMAAILSMTLLLAATSGCDSPSSSSSAASPPAPDSSSEIAPAAPGNGEKTTISVAWGATESAANAAWFSCFWDPFMAENPDVNIDFISQSGIEDTLRVQLAAGAGPDLFMCDSFGVPDYADSGRILPLDSYAQQYGWDERFFGWSMDACSYDGKLYGVPHAADVTGLYYNAELLTELGLEVPTTREEFVACCEAAKAAGYIPIGLGFSDGALYTQWLFDHYVTGYCGKEGIEKLFTGQLKFTDPEISGAFEMIKSDWDAGYINDGMSGAITADEGRAMFTQGKALFNPEGIWLSTSSVEPGTWKFDWGFTVWPSMKDGVPAAGGTGIGDMICMNAVTKNPDLCAELLDFMYKDPQRVASGVAAGLEIPCIELPDAVFPADTSSDTKESVAAFAKISSDPNVSYCPWSGYSPKTNVWIYENISKLWYGEYTLEQFLTGAQEVLDGELADGYAFVPYE